MDKVRCPVCLGAKKVAKLGGMIGDCNNCKGEGTVEQEERLVTVVPVVNCDVDEIKKAVSNALPINVQVQKVVEPIKLEKKPVVKVDPKKVLYKHKKA